MARNVGTRADIAEATDNINQRQVDRMIALVRDSLPRGVVGILGLSYKPETAVVEESQGIAIASRLAADGYKVIAFDPQAGDAARSVLGGKAEIVGDAESCVKMANVLIIATAWPSFKNIALQAFRRAKGPLTVIDCWRMLPPAEFGSVADLVYLGQSTAPMVEPPAAAASATA
jgi:UDPglucose 6-dehydrogenase